MKNLSFFMVVLFVFVSLAMFAGCSSSQTVHPEPLPPQPQPPVVTPAEPVPPQDDFKVEHNCLVLPSDLVFVPHSDEIVKESMPVIAYVKSFLAAKSYVTLLRIEAHEANDGDDPAELQTLSESRSLSVARQLVALGIDCQRLLPVGFGVSKPVADNSTPQSMKANRRVVFAIAAIKGRPVGGMPVDGGGVMAGDPCK